MADTDINATISTGVAIAVGFDGTSINEVVFAGTNAIDVSIEGSSGIEVTLGYGVDGANGTSGSSGTSGTGGTSGTSGSSGSSGTSGSAGSHGTSGTSGTDGSHGTSGSSGTSGTNGSHGTSGTSGSAGSHGTSGTSGTSGSSGSHGTSGTSGTDGSHGTSGTSGTDGTSGSSGTSGTDGSHGTSGSSGTSGTDGSHGTSGTDGSHGTSGSSGTSGTDGSAGTSGTSGSAGSHGTSGTDGSSGTSGSAGSHGTSGTDGSAGSSGTSGTDGSAGTSGTDGTHGTSGTSGTDGSSGSSGTSGTDGSSGSSGTSGIDGSHGTSGSSGTSGTDGSSGTSGSAGSHGTSGTSGVDGTSGTSGEDGEDGTSGTSGTSGTTPDTCSYASSAGNAGTAQVSLTAASETVSGVVELATSTEAIAGTDALRVITPAGNAASEAVIKNPLQISQGISMVYASTGATGIAVADNDNIDLGTGDFTLVWRGSLPDWTPSTLATLIYKYSSNYGYGLFVNTDGTLLIQLYRNSSSGTGFTSTVANTLLFRTVHEITAVVTRETAVADGSVVFYIDGVQLGASVAITAESPVTLNNAATLYISGAANSRTAAVANFAAIFRRALTSDEVISLYRTGLYDGDQWGSVTPLYSSDFSVNEDGWLKSSMGTLAGNIDGIAGEDDWLRGYATNTYTTHRMYRVITGFNGRAYYRVNFKYYIPATNTNCNGIKLVAAGLTSVAYGTLYNTTGSVVEASEIYYTNNDTRIGLQFTLVKNGGAFTGVGADTDDLVYIKDFTVTNLGAVIALEPEGIQPAPGQWLDSSSNKLHAMQPATGSSLIRSKKEFEIRWTNTWAGTHEAQYVGGLNRAILPPNCYIQSYIYVISGTTVEDVIIGDGSDTDWWVTVTTGLAAGTGEFTLANRISDGTNYKIVIDPDANFTGSITSLIKGVILE